MKLLSIFVLFGFALTSAAQTRLDITPMAKTWVDEYDLLHSYIPGLGDDLFREFEIRDSRGPRWQDDAVSFLEGEFDFHESSSYWYERAGEDTCDFGDTEWNDISDSYEVRWRAVKKISGSKKSVMYLVEHYTVLTAEDFYCEILEDEHVFLNKLNDGKPIYLGLRELKLPRGYENWPRGNQ